MGESESETREEERGSRSTFFLSSSLSLSLVPHHSFSLCAFPPPPPPLLLLFSRKLQGLVFLSPFLSRVRLSEKKQEGSSRGGLLLPGEKKKRKKSSSTSSVVVVVAALLE